MNTILDVPLVEINLNTLCRIYYTNATHVVFNKNTSNFLCTLKPFIYDSASVQKITPKLKIRIRKVMMDKFIKLNLDIKPANYNKFYSMAKRSK